MAERTKPMRESQILFKGAMVRAVLHEQNPKTQTRRLVDELLSIGRVTEFGPSDTSGYDWQMRDKHLRWNELRHADLLKRCPYGEVGDRLWGRETWQYADWTDDGYPYIRYQADGAKKLHEHIPEDWSERLNSIWAALSEDENYNIDNRAADRRWRPGIHMPRWACRLELDIVVVRVERLQDISHHDAIAEGVHRIQVGSGYADRFSATPATWAEVVEQRADAYEDARLAYRDLWESINGAGSWAANPWVWVIKFRLSGRFG